MTKETLRYFNFRPETWQRIKQAWNEYRVRNLGLEGELFFEEGGQRRKDEEGIEADIHARRELVDKQNKR